MALPPLIATRELVNAELMNHGISELKLDFSLGESGINWKLQYFRETVGISKSEM